MVVINVTNDNVFIEELRLANSKLVICDFYAIWCNPCHLIAPTFESLSNSYSNVVFLKVNVDQCQMTCKMHKVVSMPTFIAFLNKKELGRISGANPKSLEQFVTSHITSKNVFDPVPLMEKKWLQKITALCEKVKQYEDSITQTLALSLLPFDKLKDQSTINSKLNQYELAKNLMSWFHDNFFTWFDSPKCSGCNKPQNLSSIDLEENYDDMYNVEIFLCKDCNITTRFPRYNNVRKLLETRKGRCGEWASCFALFCRSVGFDTRWVSDNLDHVWVEIWSNDLMRWIHLDPCENVIDTPLMYEKGWGKKYSYIFAYAIDHVRDVTFRYSIKHKEVISRRNSCREWVLQRYLNKLNIRLSNNLSEERKDHLTKIFIKELVEFCSPHLQLRNGSEAENYGRISGSETWRYARGELANRDKFNHVKGKIINLTNKEITNKCFLLQYDCVKDKYFRPNNDECIVENGWKSYVFEEKNIFRKIELDWKITYLCRTEGTKSGSIAWKINLNKLKIKKLEISMGELVVFETGQIVATVCCGDFCSIIPNNLGKILLEDIGEADYVQIQVQFFNGQGDCAWQHAQLFRTKHTEASNNLTIRIDFV